MKNEINENSQTYVRRSLFPYYAKVLSRATYDGKLLTYSAEVDEKSVLVKFDTHIVGNYLRHLLHDAEKLYGTGQMIIAQEKKLKKQRLAHQPEKKYD